MVENNIFEIFTFRGYGFSEGLTYAYGIVLGLIGGVSLLYFNKYKWIVFFLPLLALSILVNARTGMIVLLGCLILYSFMNRKIGLKLLSLLILIVTALLSVDFVFEDDYTIVFIEEFFKELGDIFMGTNTARTSTADVLLKDHLVLPTYFEEWFLGSGISIFRSIENSDVGYVIQLNYGGVVYLLLLVILLFQLLKQVDNKYILLILLFTFLVANLKVYF